MRNGKSREMGLGSTETVSLKEARAMRDDWRRRLRIEGIDPIEARRKIKSDERLKQSAMTFQAAAELYIRTHETTWRNAKHRQQWSSTLATYAYPAIGSIPAHLIDETDILSVLRPLWANKTETAGRLRGRMELILSQPEIRKLRKGDNPARWRGNLDSALPAGRKVHRVQHHAAMPFDRVPAFFERIRNERGSAVLALRFLILCASRTGEVLGATWSEINWESRTWIIPGLRMKGAREHRVPLSPPALEVLMAAKRPGALDSDFVFASPRGKGPLSNMAMSAVLKRLCGEKTTVHGFRSSFRNWAAERTDAPREVAELSLAHAVAGQVELAYLRTDLLEKRRDLMRHWSLFLSQQEPNRSAVRDATVSLFGLVG